MAARLVQENDPLARFAGMPDILDIIFETLAATDLQALAQTSAVARRHIDRSGYQNMGLRITASREPAYPYGTVTISFVFQPFEQRFQRLVQLIMPVIMDADEFVPWPGWNWRARPYVILVICQDAAEGTLLAHVR